MEVWFRWSSFSIWWFVEVYFHNAPTLKNLSWPTSVDQPKKRRVTTAGATPTASVTCTAVMGMVVLVLGGENFDADPFFGGMKMVVFIGWSIWIFLKWVQCMEWNRKWFSWVQTTLELLIFAHGASWNGEFETSGFSKNARGNDPKCNANTSNCSWYFSEFVRVFEKASCWDVFLKCLKSLWNDVFSWIYHPGGCSNL